MNNPQLPQAFYPVKRQVIFPGDKMKVRGVLFASVSVHQCGRKGPHPAARDLKPQLSAQDQLQQCSSLSCDCKFLSQG